MNQFTLTKCMRLPKPHTQLLDISRSHISTRPPLGGRFGGHRRPGSLAKSPDPVGGCFNLPCRQQPYDLYRFGAVERNERRDTSFGQLRQNSTPKLSNPQTDKSP